MLAEKLDMLEEGEAERWIVNLIRNARLDAKIDSKQVGLGEWCFCVCCNMNVPWVFASYLKGQYGFTCVMKGFGDLVCSSNGFSHSLSNLLW